MLICFRSSLASLVVLCGTVDASAQWTHRLTLDELRNIRLPDVVLESVTPVASDAQGNLPGAAHAKVDGVIGGNIRFELLLPDSWNERFVKTLSEAPSPLGRNRIESHNPLSAPMSHRSLPLHRLIRWHRLYP